MGVKAYDMNSVSLARTVRPSALLFIYQKACVLLRHAAVVMLLYIRHPAALILSF